MQVEVAQSDRTDVAGYLKGDAVRNAFDLWFFERRERRYKLYLCTSDDRIKGHLGIYDTPEAVYTNLGGEPEAAEELLHLIPRTNVALTTTSELGEIVLRKINCDAVYPNNLMLVNRGEERLASLEKVVRLSSERDAIEYSSFGASFNVPLSLPLDWTKESLERDLIFGVFAEDDHRLASVASLSAWSTLVPVIVGVETKPEFRRKGFGAACVSATVQEALKRSSSCSLFVRSNNESAIRLYDALGFRKIGEELWIDIGSEVNP
jgi:RimJ/RimL family protein N-acetyltransferase